MENMKNMYDIALKPLILRTLLKEDVPDEKTPFDSPSKLSRVVSYIQTHKLLSESLSSATHSDDSLMHKHVRRWNSAVDDWISRLVSLITSTSTTTATTITPDKCWAGICLLGVTCQECSGERFLGSYAVWFEKLLVHVQSPTDSQIVKVAACTSVSDLITRLAGFPNVKKDGTSLAGKVIQPVLKLLNEDSAESVWEGAIHLLRAAITFFPASLHRHYDSVEAAITSKILSGKCSVNVLKTLACTLALLPKSRGDEDSWLLLMRKILLLVNGYLTDILHGLEEDMKCDEAVRLLLPPGEVPPNSLWGQTLLEETSDKERKRAKLSSISILMLSCCTMLTNSYPVQVTIPVRSLLALVERVLMVDGSLPHATSAFVILADQEFICSELPVLHSYSLDLLISVIKGLRSQLLPHAAYTVRLVKEYFGRCEVPELRIKLYSVTKTLLISMGVGIAMYLAQEVVNNSLLDLNPTIDDASAVAKSNVSSEAFLQPFQRKRKHRATGSLEQQDDRIGLEMEKLKNHLGTPISVKIAALEALEALLTVGGALRSESWRPAVDHCLITIAMDCWKEVNEERNTFLSNVPNSTYADLQLASLRALLASLLSPSCVRPPHLSQSLELFRRGRQETGTRLSEFCAYALLALEVLIHPRALPLIDFSSANSFREVNRRFPETINSGSQKQKTPFSTGNGIHDLGLGPPDSDDDLYKSWLDNSKETETPVGSIGKIMDAENSYDSIRIPAEKMTSMGGSSSAKSPGRTEHELAATRADVEMRSYSDDIMIESQQFPEPLALQETSNGAKIPAVPEDPTVARMELTNPGALDPPENKVASVDVVMADKSDGARVGSTSLSTAKTTTFAFESGRESPSDSFPDIVDADPDSD